MATYIYQAYNKENKIVNGEYEAFSHEEVASYLEKHNLTPVSIKAINNSKEGVLSIELFGGSITSVDILFLVRNLATTTKAGLSIVESIDILIKDTKKKSVKKILLGVLAMIKNGQSLSSSFGVYKKSFPPIFMGMIKAGESSGSLDKNLKELSNSLSKEYTLRNKVKSALAYPTILLVSAIVVVGLMLMFVLPKLTASFLSNGVKIPLMTRIFMSISHALTWNIWLDAIVVAFLVFFFTSFRKTTIGQKFFSFILSHTPVAKELVKKVAIVRFTRTFGNLLGSGMSVIDALNISSESINNNNYNKAITNIIEDIKRGETLSSAISKYPKLFPSLLISLVVVGEKTGSLEEILMNFSDFYEEEVDNQLKELTSFLEPVLLLIMGLMIGAIAVSIILPIYQLVGNFV